MATVTNDRETVSLIGSDKVEGTAVYGADDQKIGSIQRIMIDKISGRSPMRSRHLEAFSGLAKIIIRCPGQR